MTAKRFFDTNVVIYAYDDSEPTKQAVARSLLLNAAATATGVISTQVLGEFFHATVVRRPLLTVANARTALRALSRLYVATIPPSLVEQAVICMNAFSFAIGTRSSSPRPSMKAVTKCSAKT